MREAVRPDGVHARIVQSDLDSATGSGVVLADVLNIFTQARNKTHGVPFPSTVVLCVCDLSKGTNNGAHSPIPELCRRHSERSL